MEQDTSVEEQFAHTGRVGDRLRAAREKAGFDLEQVAAETRIPIRHLQSIEAGQFGALPSRTYAVGFSRTYARTVGLDEREIIDQVRAELAEGDLDPRTSPARFEPGDPARVPGRGLAWFAVLAGIILVAGIYAFYSTYFAPGLGPAPLRDPAEEKPAAAAAAPAAAPAATPTGGPVVFTNEMDGTWVRFYDGTGKTLFEGIMAKGDKFTVPADAANPQIRTGRPYAFTITVGGKAVPKLSEVDEVVSNVPVDAAALIARPVPAPSVSTTLSAPATPAPVATP
ncbi:helix-turn-helix domain-containing protein [Qipengyuania sp. RANM35]|uniref:helix-turn-helix domain-containing protein n=1 Tax=Qipengyuania sp. RANM35 TaxID=3068635 RepID=UPI0034DB6CFF